MTGPMTSPKTAHIPPLTPEESSMVYDASHLEHPSLSFVLRYLHWARARGQMVAAITNMRQLSLIGQERGDES